MLDKVLETIKQYNMLKAGDKVICALSGGADSMALLYALYELRDTLDIEVYAAHLNHSIRGEDADCDTRFVQDFCESINVKLFVKKCDIPKISKEEHLSEEECGREERYAAAVRDIAWQEKVCFIDLREYILRNREFKSLYCEDGIHLNDKGQRYLFDCLMESGIIPLAGRRKKDTLPAVAKCACAVC